MYEITVSFVVAHGVDLPPFLVPLLMLVFGVNRWAELRL